MYARSDKLIIPIQRFEVLGIQMTNLTDNDSANPTQLNIAAIAKLEHEALLRRTLTELSLIHI